MEISLTGGLFLVAGLICFAVASINSRLDNIIIILKQIAKEK